MTSTWWPKSSWYLARAGHGWHWALIAFFDFLQFLVYVYGPVPSSNQWQLQTGWPSVWHTGEIFVCKTDLNCSLGIMCFAGTISSYTSILVLEHRNHEASCPLLLMKLQHLLALHTSLIVVSMSLLFDERIIFKFPLPMLIAIYVSLYLGFPRLGISSLLLPNRFSGISGYPELAVSSGIYIF